MKEYISIPTLQHDRVSAALIDELVAIYPEGERRGRAAGGKETRTFCFPRVPRSDPRVEQVLRTLRKHGWYPKVDKSTPYEPNEYRIVFNRKYSRRDYERSQFLLLAGARVIKHYGRHRMTDLLKIHAPHLRKTSLDILAPENTTLVIRERLRHLLEDADLRHIVFRPVIPLKKGLYASDDEDEVVPWDKIGDTWWELTSPFVLPPLNLGKDIELVDTVTRLPISDYESGRASLQEGLYENDPELHFRYADMQQLGPFDLAVTKEKHGSPPEPWHVASQRLYQLFVKHNIRATWRPVRLDKQ